jgi:type II secretory pathway pseudopilin PulG
MMMQFRQEGGFTLVEVIIACAIMIILCIGTLTVFTHAVKINTGNNLRSQAESVLQAEVEYYRSLKFVPGAQTTADLTNHRSADLYGSPSPGTTITRPQRTSSDGQVFNITVVVKNVQYATGGNDEAHVVFKEITVTAVPASAQSSRPGWVSDANLRTNITFQRVRTN